MEKGTRVTFEFNRVMPDDQFRRIAEQLAILGVEIVSTETATMLSSSQREKLTDVGLITHEALIKFAEANDFSSSTAVRTWRTLAYTFMDSYWPEQAKGKRGLDYLFIPANENKPVPIETCDITKDFVLDVTSLSEAVEQGVDFSDLMGLGEKCVGLINQLVDVR